MHEPDLLDRVAGGIPGFPGDPRPREILSVHEEQKRAGSRPVLSFRCVLARARAAGLCGRRLGSSDAVFAFTLRNSDPLLPLQTMEALRSADHQSKQGPRTRTRYVIWAARACSGCRARFFLRYEADPRHPFLYRSPIVNGASVLALKYRDGVMIMSDTLASYGSMARFKSVQRIAKVNETTVLGASGEYSDFQYIKDLLEELADEDFDIDDGSQMEPKQVYSYLSRVLYNRRCKANPLYNQLVVAGFSEGKSFLGSVDLYGSTFEENILATGYGMYLALPLLRKGYSADMDEKQARALLEESMRVLFYRDCRTINKYNIAKVTAEGVQISKPYSLKTKWDFKRFVKPDLNE